MKINLAKRLLEKVGYDVSYTIGNTNVYVQRNHKICTLKTRNGEVSDRTVNKLLDAMFERVI